MEVIMPVDDLSDFIRENYEIIDWKHACSILKNDFPSEWGDVVGVLTEFRLKRSNIITPGGRKSPISSFIDSYLYGKGWVEKFFDTKRVIDNEIVPQPTHKIDCYKNRVALEIEWNNKDPFYDRDLNNFRILFDLNAISIGVIITRCDELQEIFDELGKGSSYGASTTHMSRLKKRIDGLGGGGCPILVFGISKNLYIED
jgi:hypothetical protein